MTTIVAALDDDETAPVTLEAARVLAEIYGATVDALHVADGADAPASLSARMDGTPLRVVSGEIPDVVAAAIAHPEVVAAAIGVRSVAGSGRPAGHVALAIASRIAKPLALVPPEADISAVGRPRRVLVPLNGTEDSALTVRALVRRVAATNVEVVVLHVFDRASVPSFLDRPEHDLPVWASEFLARSALEPGCRMRWRTGPAGAGIVEAVESEHADAVVLGWSQVLDPGRALVVREVLERAHVPVVLVPRAASERALSGACA